MKTESMKKNKQDKGEECGVRERVPKKNINLFATKQSNYIFFNLRPQALSPKPLAHLLKPFDL